MSKIKSKQLFLLVLSLAFSWCSAWDNEELEMFDLVEEINKNFYEVLGVDQTAKSSEIRKAYRRLSLQLHPDKNRAEDADVQFRQLVAVYEVLKDETRRKQYDEVLVNGLPDWRMPVYYYRRVRKMGLIELSLLLFLILTIGHYLVIWSIYLERKFTMEEWFTEIRKKKEKKARKKKTDVGEEMDELFQEELDQLPRPQFRNILPFQCVRLFVHVIVSLPSYCTMTREYMQEVRERRRQQAEESQQVETEQVEEVVKKVKKRRKVELPEYSPDLYEPANVVVYSPVEEARNDDTKQIIKTGEWTDEELGLLAKAVAKFPGGTLGRWEKVGEMVGRTPAEVITKSKSLKGSVTTNVNPKIQGLTGLADKPTTFKGRQVISDDIISTKDSETVTQNSNSASAGGTVKQKPSQSKLNPTELASVSSQPEKKTSGKLTNVPKTDVPGSDTWTQNQQMILEWALKQYPKGTDQRWEKVAEHIPGKSKEDCVTRFKHLAEMVRKRKEQAS